MTKGILLIAAIVVALALSVLLAGCTNVTVEKTDGTKVTVTTWGSSQVSDMAYDRKEGVIALKIGEAANTPDGMDEVIKPITDAATAIGTGGVSSAAEVLKPDEDD